MSLTVGVVVPCKNERDTLGTCLRSVRAQGSQVARVVVVDNGSTDGSAEIAEELADEVVRLPDARISRLRNTGALRCRDLDLLAFVDADCELLPGWLDDAESALGAADLVSSRSLAGADATWVARRWAAIESHQAHEASLAWSQHLLVRTDRFLRLGGFDEQMTTGEDAELSRRLRLTGGTVALLDGMPAVHHGFPATVRDFWRRERWHTSTPGWFAPMSTKSRALVVLAGAWGVASAAVLAGAAVRRSPWPLGVWAAGSAAALGGLGTIAGGNARHALQDGSLMSLWALNRALRAPAELKARA